MQPIDFPEANKTFTKPSAMSDEECAPLRVQDTGEALVSCWQPDEAERARIAAGAPVRLRVIGRGHPPVMLEAGTAEPGRVGLLVGQDVRLEVLDTKPGNLVVVTLSGRGIPPEHFERIGALLGERLRPTGTVGLVVNASGSVTSLDGMTSEDRMRLLAAIDAWRAKNQVLPVEP
jgi:hypothetical protein